jgi:hypothetical protein
VAVARPRPRNSMKAAQNMMRRRVTGFQALKATE